MATGILGTAKLGSFGLGFGPEAPPDPFNQTVAQTMLTDSAVYDPVYNVFVSQRLFDDGGSVADALYRAVTQTMLTDLGNPDQEIDVAQYLGFTDRHFETVGNIMFWEEVDNRVTVAELATAANFFFTNPGDDNKALVAYNGANTFGFLDAAALITTLDVENLFALADALDSSANTYNRAETQGFLKQSLAFTVDDNSCREQEYDPIVGETEKTDYGTVSTTPPTLTNGTLTLTYPYVTPTLTLVLENPDFGNSDINSFTRIDRRTRGGDRKIFSDPNWATWERLELSLTGIQCPNVTIDQIITFLNSSLGKEIGLLDWEGRQWKGLIVAPETDVAEDLTGFALTLVFEGELV